MAAVITSQVIEFMITADHNRDVHYIQGILCLRTLAYGVGVLTTGAIAVHSIGLILFVI